jgi:hypothetical protein
MASPDSTFETIADIISETASVERGKITPEAHVINDLGHRQPRLPRHRLRDRQALRHQGPGGSLDRAGEQRQGAGEQFFVLGALARRIEELVAAKPA